MSLGRTGGDWQCRHAGVRGPIAVQLGTGLLLLLLIAIWSHNKTKSTVAACTLAIMYVTYLDDLIHDVETAAKFGPSHSLS